MHPARLLACASAVLATATAPALAAEPIATDRPDFVESSDVVDAGRVQLELGFTIERDRSDRVRARGRSTPTLLRVGLGHDLEARIETDGLLRARSTDTATGITTRASGSADVALGLKWHMADADAKAGKPSMAWLLHVDMATGSTPFRGDGNRPSLRFVAEWELPGDTSIGVMPGLARDSDDQGRRFTAGILAVTASTALAPRWRGFVELAGQRLASKARGGNVASFDTGLTYLLNDDMQLDVSLAKGLTRQTADLGYGVGFSIRF